MCSPVLLYVHPHSCGNAMKLSLLFSVSSSGDPLKIVFAHTYSYDLLSVLFPSSIGGELTLSDRSSGKRNSSGADIVVDENIQ